MSTDSESAIAIEAGVAARRHAPYLLFIVSISVLSLGVLATSELVDVDVETRQILDYADLGLCAVFFADFLRCFAHAEDKRRYLFTWGLLDLLSSVPAVDVLRWGRAARLLRVLRLLRGVRSGRILLQFILAKRAESAALAAIMITVLTISAASIAIFPLEREGGATANIRSAEDAIWWTMATLTTVGYGDCYPVTSGGRMLAITLMIIGVGLIGTWAGIAATWFLAPAARAQTDDINALRMEMQRMRELLERRGAD